METVFLGRCAQTTAIQGADGSAIGRCGLLEKDVGPDHDVLGIELSVSHHRSVGAGTVTGRATVLSHGSTVSSWQVVVEDEQGRRLSTARVTCLIRERRATSPSA